MKTKIDRVRANDGARSAALAILLFVDPQMPGGPCDHLVAGAKHFLIFLGETAEDVYRSAISHSKNLERNLTEMSESELAKEVLMVERRYRPTRFLGFQEVTWLVEPIGEGNIVYVSRFNSEGSTGSERFAVYGARWPVDRNAWCVAEVTGHWGTRTSRRVECMVIFRASNAAEASGKANDLIGEERDVGRSRLTILSVRDVTLVDDDLDDDGAELLYFTCAKSGDEWQRLTRAKNQLAIFSDQHRGVAGQEE